MKRLHGAGSKSEHQAVYLDSPQGAFKLRLDGAKLNDAIVRGTERATREHPLRSSIVAPLTRENRQTSTGEGIPIIHYHFVPDSDVARVASREGEAAAEPARRQPRPPRQRR